ncbi:MAG: hypothetical protein D6788_02890 [Planctomycetota bacterium]|nr:MAG: hypothetical protein D6788_02890 [Planctomycetota bacterium]
MDAETSTAPRHVVRRLAECDGLDLEGIRVRGLFRGSEFRHGERRGRRGGGAGGDRGRRAVDDRGHRRLLDDPRPATRTTGGGSGGRSRLGVRNVVMADPVPTSVPDRHAPSRSVFALALVTAAAVFPLVFVGAGVTSKGVGMAFPDGFTADGYFLRNPPGWWDKEATRWEHGHRLLGRAVGLLAIALAVAAWKSGGTVRRLAILNLVLICIQGTLGAFRVYEVSTSLAMIHGVFAQVCFCVTSSLAMICAPTWQQPARQRVREARFLQRLCAFGTGVVFLQLVTGAAYRHFGASILLIAHVFWAVVVLFIGGWIVMWVLSVSRERTVLSNLGRLFAALLAGQLLLGAGAYVVTILAVNVSRQLRWLVPSLHVLVGALVLVCSVLLTLCAFRFLEPAPLRRDLSSSKAVAAG